MREYDCGVILNHKINGRFVVREYDYYESELIFCNYGTGDIITIKKSNNLNELKEIGWWLFDRVDEGRDLNESLKIVEEQEIKQDEYDAIAEMEAQDRYGEEIQRFEETQREDKWENMIVAMY